MITNKYKQYLTGAFVAALLIIFSTSCKKDLPEIKNTQVMKMAGTWWVTKKLNGVPQLDGEHVKINTFNTAADDGKEMWVQDQGLGFDSDFQARVAVNTGDLTFSATNSKDHNSDATVTITGGKVFPGLGKSKSGHVTDSIYMEVLISSDPGKKYVVSGVLRTKFDEDDY
jgi:hypothetical protein